MWEYISVLSELLNESESLNPEKLLEVIISNL